MKLAELHKLFLHHPIICRDSRKATKGSLFFALKGENFDGNNFAIDALNRGCEYAIIDNPKGVKNEKYILVDDVLQTLQQLANYHRNYCNTKIIAVTGTNGKTTTKEFINVVLSQKYATIATEGNLNNHIGVPLTLLRLTPETEIGIIEMGANHLKEIEELCKIVEPDYGIITNIGKAHIEGFGSEEGIFKTKTELYEAVVAKNGTLFVNADDKKLFPKAKELCQSVFSYGTQRGDVRGKLGTPSLRLQVELEGNPLQTQLFGIYNLPNLLASFAIGKYFDVPEEDMYNAIGNYIPTNNRSQIKETEKNLLILDAYNANPTSMKNAILSFDYTNCTNKHLILGDMLELGHLSETAHAEVKKLLKELNLDTRTWLVGKHFSKEKVGNFTYFENTETVAKHLKNNPLQGKQIILKGSNGIKLYNLEEIL